MLTSEVSMSGNIRLQQLTPGQTMNVNPRSAMGVMAGSNVSAAW